MSNPAVDVAVRVSFQDHASDGLDRFVAKQQKAMTGTERFVGASNERQQQSFARLSEAREVLGLRSGKVIQNEIKQTEERYERLMTSGKLSADQQARAADTVRERIARLTQEMSKLAVAQQRQAAITIKTAPMLPPQAAKQIVQQTVQQTIQRVAQLVMPDRGIDIAAAKQQQALAGSERFAIASNERQQQSFARLSQAREVLGLRSERAIQNEIRQTEAAYQRLAQSGKLSADEQARALDKTREHVTRLTNEMGKLTVEQQKQSTTAKNQERGRGILTAGGAAVAGAAAASYVLRPKIETAMQYDYALAHMSNTAFNDRDVAGRRIGMKQLDDAITAARQKGGGTREDGAGALDAMIASGTMSAQDAMSTLPVVMKAATASNTDPREIATIAFRTMQNMKVKAEDLPKILNMAMAGGQAGGFELRDMAKWLPQQMAFAKNIGLSGVDGMAKIIAMNQASVITSGSKDEAGNNLKDYFQLLSTQHFQDAMAKSYLNSGHRFKKGQKEVALKNISDVYLNYQSKGIDKSAATEDMVKKILSKNKTYATLQAQLMATDETDKAGRSAIIETMAGKRDIIEAMSNQLQGSELAKIFHNQQSFAAFLGMMNGAEYLQKNVNPLIQKNRVNNGGAMDDAHELIKGTGSYNQQQKQEAIKNAEKKALDDTGYGAGVNKSIGELADKFPQLTGSLSLAVPAVGALAGAAALAATALGKNAGGGVIGKVAGTLGAAMPVAAKWLPQMAKGASVAGVASVAGDYAFGKAFGEKSAITRYGKAISTGAGMGAMAGAPFAGVGAIPAAIGGGLLGAAWAAGDDFKALFQKPPAEAEKPKMDATIKLQVSDGRVRISQTQTSSQNVNATWELGNIHQGMPL